MGRPERPLNPHQDPVQNFAFALRRLRESAGRPSYRELAARAHYSITALSEAAGGVVLPSLPVALAYAEACGGDRRIWEAQWRAAESAVQRAAERVAGGAAEAAAERVTGKVARKAAGPVATNPLSTVFPSDEAANTGIPYLGSATYTYGDAGRFFGRTRSIEELCGRLRDETVLAVVGASGSGKSSLLRAGLLPALRADAVPGSAAWRTVFLTPGERPIEELADRLADLSGMSAVSPGRDPTARPGRIGALVRRSAADRPEGAKLLVVVDEFEEIFTRCHDDRGRSLFVDALLTAAHDLTGTARVVLGLRSDFITRCEEHPALAAVLRDARLTLGPMQEDELRQVITRPAAQAGLRVEKALVEKVIGDVRGEPGRLPLLSRALLETWRRRERNTLTLAAYRAAGGVQGMVVRLADQVHTGLGPGERRILRNILVRLTALGEGVEDTRRRVRPAELLECRDSAAVAAVLNRLAAAHLVSLDDDGVQVSHTAIIRSWPPLRGWLAEDREMLRAHRRLTEAAIEWDQRGCDDDSLYRGARLAEWGDRPEDRLNDLERAFLRRSRDRAVRERARRQRQALQARLGLVSVTTLASMLAVTVLLALTAWTTSATSPDSAGRPARATFGLPLLTQGSHSCVAVDTREADMKTAAIIGHAGAAALSALSTLALSTACGSTDVNTEPEKEGQGQKSSAPATSQKTAKLGDAVRVSDKDQDISLSVTLTKVVDPAKPADEFSSPEAGSRYVAAQFQVKNLGEKVYEDAPSNGARLIDAEGQAYDTTIADVVGCRSFASESVRLTSGETQKGCVVFDVDKKAKPQRIRFTAASGFSAAAEWSIK